MPIETIISIATLAFMLLGSVIAFFVKGGKLESRIEQVEKRAAETASDLEGGLESVRKEAAQLKEDVVETQITNRLIASTLDGLKEAIQQLTPVISQLSHWMADVKARDEEREKSRDRRAGQS